MIKFLYWYFKKIQNKMVQLENKKKSDTKFVTED